METEPSKMLLVSAAAVFAFGVLSLQGGVPSLVSPGGFLVTIVALITTDPIALRVHDPTIHGLLVQTIAALPPALGFITWSYRPVSRGGVVPLRSVVLFASAVVLSIAFLSLSWDYGVRYQGKPYTVEIITINSIVVLALAAVLLTNRRVPARSSNLLFHTGLFCWLAWCAFPWLGELI